MVGYGTIFLYKHQDGTWSESPSDFHNRGFLFGDGLFETMVFDNGKIRNSEFHFARLNEGIKILGLNAISLTTVADLEKLIQKSWGFEKNLRVRWNVYRSGMGKYSPETDALSESMHIQPFIPATKIKQRAFISQTIRLNFSPWSHCKTLSAMQYVMANLERQRMGFDEVILSNHKDFIVEAGSSNLFWIKEGKYFTPALDSGCVAGVGRRIILNYFKEKGIIYEEGLFKVEDILNADTVFTSNVTGLSFIHSIGKREFRTDGIDFLEKLFGHS